MTLPANDAFSFGLTGSHDPSRPAYSLSLRSTSPKIPFVSTRTRSPPPHTLSRKPSRPRRSMSNGSEGGHHPQHETPSQARIPSRTDRGALTRKTSKSNTGHRPKPPVVVPIDWEIPRKLLHSSIGFLTLYLYISHGSPRPVVVALGSALAIIAPADILRLNSPGFERAYEKCLGFLMRESEKKTANGVVWYIIGVIWVLSLYPIDIAVVSILILSWVDTAASTFGRLWGRLTPPLPPRVPLLGLPFAPRKSMAGFIAGTVTGALVAAGFWGWIGPVGNIDPTWTLGGGVAGTGVLGGWVGLSVVSLVTGLVSGVSEALDLGSLDDNLTLPIISGGCLLGFFKCLQYLFS